jgi:hypothetical protein
METPTSIAQYLPLHRFLGTWIGQEELLSEGEGAFPTIATTVSVARLELSGFFIIADHLQRQESGQTYHNHLIYGWDIAQQQYTMYQFSSRGIAPGHGPARGIWQDNTLRFEQQSSRGHLRFTYVFESDTVYAFDMDQSNDMTTWRPLIRSHFHRM